MNSAPRYDRQERIEGWSQANLSQACVLVVGAGALGNEVIKNLALVGVGRILIVDDDRIELSNLSRAVLFTPDDIGRSKAFTAACAAARLNPEIKIRAIHGNLFYDLGLGFCRHSTLIIGCLDNNAARMRLSHMAMLAGAPLLDGGMWAMGGEARWFAPHGGPCFECILSDQARQDAEFITHCLRVMLQSFEIKGKFKGRGSDSRQPAHPRNECLVITPEGNLELAKIFNVFVKPQFELKALKLVLNHLQISENTDFRDIIDPIQHARIILVLFDQASIILTYILGMVHSINANVITLLQGVDQLPFYLKKANCLIYENTATGGKDLENALKMILERPDEAFEQYRNPVAELLESGRLVKESPEFRQLYRDLESTQQIVQDLERKNDELETAKKGLESQLAELKKEDPRQLKARISQLEDAKAATEQRLAQSETDMQRLNEQNERLKRQNETLQAEVDRLNTRFVFKKVNS